MNLLVYSTNATVTGGACECCTEISHQLPALSLDGLVHDSAACEQKDMLEDHKRTGAYYQAVMQNRRQFGGKVVLDVGTGSGILAIFAANAGAKKVYAVEATDMAKFAKRLVSHNQVTNKSCQCCCQACHLYPIQATFLPERVHLGNTKVCH